MGSALCLALLFSNYSKADVVTVPIGNGLSVNVTTGTSTQSLQYINNNATATQVQLGDDGTAAVPLQFQFSYFGKTFGTSWMHSNGVVSFQDVNVTGGFCCSGEVLSNTTDSRNNYAIMPLWTDLIGQSGNNTYYLSKADSITYGWYGISQYGNRGNTSSFEVKLDSTGLVDMRWGPTAISNATVTMGFTGDLSKGQYYQYYNGSSLAVNGLGVIFNGAKMPETNTTVLKSPTGYTAVVSPSAVDTSSTPTTSLNVGGVQLSTTGEIAVPDNIPQVLRDTVASTTSSAATISTSATSTSATRIESNKSGPSVSVMNIVKQIQAADKIVQTRAVQNANQQIATSSSKAQEQAMSIVDNATTASMSSSQNGSQVSSQMYSLSMMQAPQQVSSSTSQVAAQAASQLAMLTPQPTQKSASTTFEPIEFKSFIDTSISESKIDTVNRNAQTNELAGGVDITAIATQPKGYEVYSSLTIKDAGFYAPKDIYGNQTNVDNARALRQLSSDRLHQDLVNQQFKIGK